ncbi:MAG: Mut7-C RNAse domain-containing protein [Methylomonas sp.]|nr:Mut7-C RNAse domain-containing protein [Methylomonas sp.]
MDRKYLAEFRFYDALNDFLSPSKRQQTTLYRFNGHPGIKDPIEAMGVPHTEVELIIVNSRPVGFDYQLQSDDRVAVFPAFRRLNVESLLALREPILHPRFVLDVNLGKLAKRLRLLGFDALYRNDYHDAEVAKIAADQQRIVLTRDRRLLFAKQISHGYWVRAVDVQSQIEEVVRHFDLYQAIRPFERCLVCNGRLVPVDKAEVLQNLEPKTRLYYEVFYRCGDCRRVYWEGSHMADMRRRFAAFLSPSN